MRVEITGNDKTPIERIPRDSIKPTKEGFKRYIRWQGEMELQNACIDMMEAGSREEILKIWSKTDRWYDGYTPIQFWPNMESWIKYDETGLESGEIRLEMIPENADDIRAMNKCLYDKMREEAYVKNIGVVINSEFQKWAKGLENEILEGIEKTPVEQDEYIKTMLNYIWKQVEKFSIHKYITLKYLIDEELERLILGKDLMTGKKLLHDEYSYLKISPDEGYKEFPFLFLNRIIAHDIAQIILDLETGKFFPETLDTEAPENKSRSTTDVSFKWKSNPDIELPALYDKMIHARLIAPETTPEQFTAIFSGQPIDSIEPVKWDKGPTLLAYFIYQIVFTHQKTPTTNSHWKVGALCFTRTVKKFTSDILRSSLNQSYDGHTKWPKNHEWIDNLFENH